MKVLDLSCNQIDHLPDKISTFSESEIIPSPLVALNVSRNRIRDLSGQVFVVSVNLIHLNLSQNQLELIPPQVRRLQNLRSLDISQNPLANTFQMKPISELAPLQSLHLSNTQRTFKNFPLNLDNLKLLKELDASENQLASVPPSAFCFSHLRVLNLSSNQLAEFKLTDDVAFCSSLELLDLSRNRLQQLSPSVGKLEKLKRLLLDSNLLTFDGLPNVFGRLVHLEVLSIANNQLETIPESICRCNTLRRLVLNSNRLIHLPENLSLLFDTLEQLEIQDNANIKLPSKWSSFIVPSLTNSLRKPKENSISNVLQKAGKSATYNIDFSLQTQLKQAAKQSHNRSVSELLESHAGSLPAAKADEADASREKDQLARLRRIKQMRAEILANRAEASAAAAASASGGESASKVLQGMREVVNTRDRLNTSKVDEPDAQKEIRPKRWDQVLEQQQKHPQIDYGQYFDDDVGETVGVRCWEIDNFMPVPLDDELVGEFYDKDCYVVLHTFHDEKEQTRWQIFYWLGAGAALDKHACAAMHAVNLRNFLEATTRTIRIEQNDEPPEFLALFGTETTRPFVVLDGSRTQSGFFIVQPPTHIARLYLIQTLNAPLTSFSFTDRDVDSVSRNGSGPDDSSSKQDLGHENGLVAGGDLWMEAVPMSLSSLDSRYVYLLDTHSKLHLWVGRRSKQLLRTKSRLLAEKLNRQDRKGQAELRMHMQGFEEPEWWQQLGVHVQPTSAAKAPLASTAAAASAGGALTKEHIKELLRARAAANAALRVSVPDLLPGDWRPRQPLLYRVELGAPSTSASASAFALFFCPLPSVSSSLLFYSLLH